MLPIVVALSIVGLVPLIFVWPHVGILAWYWFGLMNPHRLIWGALEEQRYALLIGGATLLAWFLSREAKRIPMGAVTVLLGLLLIWITFTTFFAHVPAHAWAGWEKAFKIMVMTFAAIALINTRERIYVLVWVIVISLGFYGFKGGLFTVLTGGEYRVWGPEKSFIADNNQLALALVMTIPLVVYLYGQVAHWLMRLGLGLLGLTCFFSVIGTQSRGGFLALCVMGGYLMVRSRHRLKMGAIVLAIASVGIWFVPQSWVDRMETIQNYEDDPSAMSRIRAWTFATKVALERPITGGGFNVQFDEAYYMRLVPDASKNRDFHSAYFEMLGEHGFIGAAIFLGLLAATWLSFARLVRRTENVADLRWAHDLARMAQVSIIGYAAAASFLNLAFYDLFYVVLALAPMLWNVMPFEDAPASAARSRRSSVTTTSPARRMPSGA
jgi:probable O-glycosylation ligase (exosortase A-associated)